MNDFPRLVLDANIMISAILGRSFPMLYRLFEGGVELFVPVQQLAETRNIISQRPNLESDWINAQMEMLLALVSPIHPAMLERYESAARSRLHERGQPDWPVLAASMEIDGAVWSHDKDFFGTGAPVWSTKILLKQMEIFDEAV